LSGERVERRLTAILAADVAGYSRLMGQDEAGTLARLRAHRRELIDPKIAKHRGRIVKTTGDGILIEFPSVVEAVACAVAVQHGMAERNAGTPEEQRIVFRVGVNLGDIIIDGDDIHGDGVNVAARLEGIAEPGGICVSGIVHDQVRDKLVGLLPYSQNVVSFYMRMVEIQQAIQVIVIEGPGNDSDPVSAADAEPIAQSLILACQLARTIISHVPGPSLDEQVSQITLAQIDAAIEHATQSFPKGGVHTTES
jgi:class 3 adenylate cyclase